MLGSFQIEFHDSSYPRGIFTLSHDKRGNYAEVLSSLTSILAYFTIEQEEKAQIILFYQGLRHEFVLGVTTSF